MAEANDDAEAHERKRDKLGKFVYVELEIPTVPRTRTPTAKIDGSIREGQKNYSKGELALKHAIGLGAGENVVPHSHPITNGPPRPVYVGWHPVGGFAGKWFAEKTGLGKMITEKTNSYPDPTQHWAVLVGEYAHQLWMDENFDIIYTNSRVVDPKEWTTSAVGQTTFNDDALRRTGEAVIQHIRTNRPGYNLITNNCQTYVLQLLDAIQVSTVKEFGTTEAVYERLFGTGKVADLFVDHMHQINDQGPGAGQTPALPPRPQELGVVGGVGGQGYVPYHRPEDMLQQYNVGTGQQPQTSVQFAQQVMDANTTQVSAEEMNSRQIDDDRHHEEGGWREKAGSFFKKKAKK